MKNKLLILLVSVGLLFTGKVVAQEGLVSLGLKETCESEGITFNHQEYEESENKANIYLFRGQSCSVCYEFISYLEKMTDTHGKYFNLISYEIWGNTENEKLMKKVAKHFGDKVTGVPYIVIGDNSWNGFSEDMVEEIFSAIIEEYENGNANEVVPAIINNVDKIDTTDIIITLAIIGTVGLFVFTMLKTKNKEV